MASAAFKIRLTCPKCDEEFRAARPDDGAKVKCPECGKAFVPDLEDDDEEEATGVQERPALKVKAKPAAKANPDEKPRSKKPRDDDDDAPKKNRRRGEEDDADDDDRPARKKKDKQKSGSMMLVILLVVLGGGFVLSLALLAVGAFVWPGFMRSAKAADNLAADTNKGPGKGPGAGAGAGADKAKDNAKDKDNIPAFIPGGNEIANFVPAEGDILVGINVKALREANQLEPILKQIDDATKGKDPMPAEIKELMRNSEKVMACLQVPDRAFQQQFPGGGVGGGGQPFPGGGFGGGQPGGGLGGKPGGGLGGQPFPPGGGLGGQPGGGLGGQPGGGLGGQPFPPGGGLGGQPGGGLGGQPGGGLGGLGGQPGGGLGGQPGGGLGGQPFPPGGGIGGPPGGFGQGGDKGKVVIAVLASNVEAVNKIRNLASLGSPQQLAGKYRVYQPAKQGGNWTDYVAFPGDRMILLCTLNEKEMTALLDSASKNQGSSNDAVKLGASVEKAHFWAAFKFNDKIREAFQAMDAQAKKTPELQGLVRPLQRAKGASMAYDVISNGAAMRIRINLECADASDAVEFRKTIEPLKDMAVGLLQLAVGKLPQSVTTDLNTITFQNQGPVAFVTMQVSQQTVAELPKLFDTKKKGFPGGDGGAKDFAKKDGAKKDRPVFDGSKKDSAKLDGFKKDGPSLDGFNKDFPTPDGSKKDSPKFDGSVPGKDSPKGGQGKSQSYQVNQMFAGKADERPAGFQQGKTVTISITSNTTVATTKFEIVVLRGNFGENAVAQKIVARTGTVSFVVPASDTYRVRVVNRGPGNATTCIVTVRVD